MRKSWWSNLAAKEQPFPHIPESEILIAMPKSLHSQWNTFLFGKTVLALPDKTAGIYPWDFERFVHAIKVKRRPVQAKQTACPTKY